MQLPATSSSSPDPPPSVDPAEAPLTAKVWDWVCWTGTKTYDGLDFAGEVLANFLGLTHSEYQWMLDLQEREKEEKKLRRLEQKQRRQLRLEQMLEEEKRKLQELEHGGGEGGDQGVEVNVVI